VDTKAAKLSATSKERPFKQAERTEDPEQKALIQQHVHKMHQLIQR